MRKAKKRKILRRRRHHRYYNGCAINGFRGAGLHRAISVFVDNKINAMDFACMLSAVEETKRRTCYSAISLSVCAKVFLIPRELPLVSHWLFYFKHFSIFPHIFEMFFERERERAREIGDFWRYAIARIPDALRKSVNDQSS